MTDQSTPSGPTPEAERDYDLRVREIALRMAVKRASGFAGADVETLFLRYERLLRGPRANR